MLELSKPLIETFTTKEQAINYITERISSVRQMMAKQPPPATDNLTSLEYLRWERRFLMEYGRAIGALQGIQAFGHIDFYTFEQLKNQLLGTMLRRTSDVQMKGV